jgi:hypothetical protein
MRRLVVVLLVVACGEPNVEDVEVPSTTGMLVDDDVLLVEFDGQAPNGVWERVQPSPPDFAFDVGLDELVMIDQGGANQHLVRSGVLIDPARAYAIDVDFVIEGPLAGLSSFAVNFQQRGMDGDLSPIDTWAMNVDLDDAPGPGGVMKSMGFVGGAFHQIDQRTIAWGEADTTYSLHIEVNRDLEGALAPDVVTVTVREADVVLERFAQDYAAFPYQPLDDAPVRFGLNTHGTNWRARNLRVAYL